MRAEEFLDKYREIEDALEEKYSGRKRRYTSVIFEYLNDEESRPYRDKLDLCREIRNLLTHSAKVGGEDIIEPSVPICEAAEEILAYIQRPPLAMDYATKGDKIFYANYNQTVLKIMSVMDKNGFSHIPILQNGKFVGVFSLGTVFSYILSHYDMPITKQTTISEMQQLLPISSHIENYRFADKDLSVAEAKKTFQLVREKNKRISVIFITENGKPDERLLAMLTPWDVMEDKET